MQKQFDIVNFLDKCRWSTSVNSNYGLINYFRNDLTNDLKLLTHWISYITDRQMAFEQIWDIGGFVFSDMLYSYKNQDKALEILKPDSKNAYFVRKNDIDFVFKSHALVSEENEILKRYNKKIGEEVEFVSRFYPADYLCMFYTLHTLQEFNKDFIEYIIALLQNVKNPSARNLIETLAYGLYILTYEGVGQPNKSDLNYKEVLVKAKSRTKRICDIINDSTKLEEGVKEFYKKGTQYKIKRVWCSIRDYIKSNEFGEEYFKKELIKRKVDKKIIKNLFSNEAKRYFELPGDVWNNNSTFRNCILQNYKCDSKEETMSFNKLLRQIYNKENIVEGYPEQFDVTFDFVPRMCDRNNCDICPFNTKNKIKNICVKDSNKYCTVALVSCNYKCKCDPKGCELLKYIE